MAGKQDFPLLIYLIPPTTLKKKKKKKQQSRAVWKCQALLDLTGGVVSSLNASSDVRSAVETSV